MKKSDVIQAILGERLKNPPINSTAKAFAPTNIALCKYWGKRDAELNLPNTSSLSISLGDKGATTEIKVNEQPEDKMILNNQQINLASPFGKRLVEFLNLFRYQQACYFYINVQTNIPLAAGLASSACGFASLVLALDQLFRWKLLAHELSILARLGSGSACRSIEPGFVEWHRGERADGMDSYGELLPVTWSELCVGLLIFSEKEKSISSRAAMQATVDTSLFYSLWPTKVKQDLANIKEAIYAQDFHLLGKTAESNAMAMHATMLSAWPPINYYLPETILAMQKIWQLRQNGLPLYFTQDAGPNLKLLFLKKEGELIASYFNLLAN